VLIEISVIKNRGATLMISSQQLTSEESPKVKVWEKESKKFKYSRKQT
jgi:hypothetical protein